VAILTGAFLTLPAFARMTQAQSVESSVDLGGLALRYADSLKATAVAVTPHVATDWERGIAEASGTFSQFTNSTWSAQGELSASLLTPVSSGFLTELGGFAGGSTRRDGTRTGEILGNGRLHIMRSAAEAFIGAGAGRTWDGTVWRNLILGEAGGTVRYANGQATLALSPIILDDTTRYTDTQLSLSLTNDRLEFAALLGARFGDRVMNLGTSARSWGSLSVIGWMTPRFALAASAGSYPVDPTQGFPGGRFVSLSLRLSTGRNHLGRSSPGPQPLLEPDAAGAGAVISGFVAERTSPGVVTLRVNSPHALAVEISGDFTNWEPVQLERSLNGWWSRAFPIAPGKYQMNVRLDGGKWLVPSGLLTVIDEFGGTAGLLVVE
jgi:hypothetical protein